MPSVQLLKSLYQQMVQIRTIEEGIAELYPEGEMRCPVHLCIGQEAISAGVCATLKQSDLVLSNHRAHGHFIAKGGNIEAMLAEIYGKATGCSKGRGGSMHLVDLAVNFLGSTPIVASIVPIATGVAFAEKMQHRKTITVVFIGDAVIEEGVFHESVNFAVLKHLPIVYVCENNLYSVYTHIDNRQPKRDIIQLVSGHGITTFTGDGNNVIEVFNLMKKAIRRLRTKSGPIFIELSTYRHREHCGPNFDNQIGYRSEQEFLNWKKRDPINLFQKYLLKKRLITAAEIEKLNSKLRQMFLETVDRVKKSSYPQTVTENDVYAD